MELTLPHPTLSKARLWWTEGINMVGKRGRSGEEGMKTCTFDNLKCLHILDWNISYTIFSTFSPRIVAMSIYTKMELHVSFFDFVLFIVSTGEANFTRVRIKPNNTSRQSVKKLKTSLSASTHVFPERASYHDDNPQYFGFQITFFRCCPARLACREILKTVPWSCDQFKTIEWSFNRN